MLLAGRIDEVIGLTVESLGYEFVACEFVPMGGKMLLRIYIDSKEGVTIKDCGVVSRQVGAVLNVENLLIDKYYLEVSSPGADRLLVTEAHYQRFIGHRVKISLRQPRNGRRNYSGQLQAVEAGDIIMVVDGDTYVLPIVEIEKANLVAES
jgi:ribosome maturation factor RimP